MAQGAGQGPVLTGGVPSVTQTPQRQPFGPKLSPLLFDLLFCGGSRRDWVASRLPGLSLPEIGFRLRAPRHVLAVALIVAAPLGLAGCGVKGPLEPPPSSQIVDQRVDPAPRPIVTPNGGLSGPAYQPPSSPAGLRAPAPRATASAPAGQQRSVLDWLID
jgi:predicted small lipoprotein YifL